MKQIFDKYNLSWKNFFFEKEKIYHDIIKWEFEHLCICLIWAKYILFQKKGKELSLSMIVSQASIENPQAAYMQLISLFYADLLAGILRETLEQLCKNFSVDRTEKKQIEQKFVSKINKLEKELAFCKERLKGNEEVNFIQKEKHYQALLEVDRTNAEQAASLEKKLAERQDLIDELNQKILDQEEYIKLLTMQEEKDESVNESMDVSRFCNKKIAFIGGLPETIKKVKKKFYNSVFISEETSAVPQKIDAIVMFSDFMSHSLFYKYIALTREKGIRLIYCRTTNIDLIMQKIGRELLAAN